MEVVSEEINISVRVYPLSEFNAFRNHVLTINSEPVPLSIVNKMKK